MSSFKTRTYQREGRKSLPRPVEASFERSFEPTPRRGNPRVVRTCAGVLNQVDLVIHRSHGRLVPRTGDRPPLPPPNLVRPDPRRIARRTASQLPYQPGRSSAPTCGPSSRAPVGTRDADDRHRPAEGADHSIPAHWEGDRVMSNASAPPSRRSLCARADRFVFFCICICRMAGPSRTCADCSGARSPGCPRNLTARRRGTLGWPTVPVATAWYVDIARRASATSQAPTSTAPGERQSPASGTPRYVHPLVPHVGCLPCMVKCGSSTSTDGRKPSKPGSARHEPAQGLLLV